MHDRPQGTGRPDPHTPADDVARWAPADVVDGDGHRGRRTPTGAELGLPGCTDLTEVARGGDSVVYRAHQSALGRDVAIKVIDVGDPATLARFRRELEITVMLGRQHPHVVTVLDTTTTADGRACLVMDFHDLGSLHDRLRTHGPLPVREVVTAGRAVADALAFAHDQGVLHRDVKPQNVLVLPTSYVLTDFGIARMADAGHTSSLERFSYRHASPQVLDGLEPTVADDVWSLGSTLSTLLHGRAPFASDDPQEDTALGYLRRVRTGAMRPQARDGVPDALTRLVQRCLSPAREDRWPDARAVAAVLAAVPTEDAAWAPDHAVEQPAVAPWVTVAAPSAPGTPPASSPVVTEPARATSALAAAGPAVPGGPAGSGPDAEPTGLGPAPRPPEQAPDETASDETASDEPAAAAGGRARRWPAHLAFVGGAVLLGSVIGTAAVMLTTPDAPTGPEPSPPATAVPIETLPPEVEIPEDDDPLDVALSDPAYAPQDVVLVDNGTSITVTWTDPTGGRAATLVVDATDESAPQPLESLSPGVTDRTVEGVDPGAPTVCLLLVAIDVDDPERFGLSEPACVRR